MRKISVVLLGVLCLMAFQPSFAYFGKDIHYEPQDKMTACIKATSESLTENYKRGETAMQIFIKGDYENAKEILSMLQQLIKPLIEFLQIIRKSAASHEMDATAFISRTSTLITVMIDAQILKERIKTILRDCDWFRYFFDIESFFAYLIDDLRAILSFLIAICEKSHNPKIDDSIDKKLYLQLKLLLKHMEKLEIFYLKLDEPNGLIAFLDKNCGPDCSICGNGKMFNCGNKCKDSCSDCDGKPLDCKGKCIKDCKNSCSNKPFWCNPTKTCRSDKHSCGGGGGIGYHPHHYPTAESSNIEAISSLEEPDEDTDDEDTEED